MVVRRARARRTPPRAVELHIEQLRLEGVTPGDRERIGAAMQLELARLLARDGIPQGWTQDRPVEQVDGGAIRIPPQMGAGTLGVQLARAAYRGFKR